MTAGYSGTPLPKKLGVKDGSRVMVLDAPAGFDLGVDLVRRGPADVVLCFVTSYAELAARFDALAEAVFPAGGLWFAWPKRASKVPTDLTENVIRDHALARGLVDNKVCAVTDVWSGLRLVHRKENRG